MKVAEELLRAGATPVATTTTGTTIFMAAVGSGPNAATLVNLLISWVDSHPEGATVQELIEPVGGDGKTAYELAKGVDPELAKSIKVRCCIIQYVQCLTD